MEKDLLYGYDAIAEYLGMTPRQVKHLSSKPAGLPTFKPTESRRVCARKSSLQKWLSDLENGGGKDNL